MKRVCKICNAYFDGDIKNTVNRLKEHKKNCSENKPYEDDNNADGYIEVTQ